ncbi:hypothetical protein HI031_08165 [Staphylococcus haemolyticus]|nr:hypothetical protein HI031_08165 [Staphylococcus haemolyticus]
MVKVAGSRVTMKVSECDIKRNREVEGVVLGEVEFEGDYEYNVEFATLSEVDYKVCALYEVATATDKLEKEDMKFILYG